MLKILLIMQLPPPRHGASFAGECIMHSERINREFQCEYVRISTVPESGGGWLKRLATMVALYWRVLKLTSRGSYDLVYITPCASGLSFYKDYFVAVIARCFAAPVIYHFHNKGISTNRFVPQFVRRHFFGKANVILLSPLLYWDVSEFVPADHVFYLPNGVDSVAAAPRLRHHDLTRIVFLSNMIRTKGVFVLLEACRQLKSRGIRFQCDFAGPWYEIRKEEFASIVAEHELSDCVHHVGAKYGRDKEALLQNADIFAFPTFYPDECSPTVLLEAMSAGLPVVSTDEGAIPEIVDDGKTGLVVARHDARGLADALEKLVIDHTLREAMGAAGHEKFRQQYTTEIFERAFVSILKQVVSDRRRAMEASRRTT